MSAPSRFSTRKALIVLLVLAAIAGAFLLGLTLNNEQVVHCDPI